MDDQGRGGTTGPKLDRKGDTWRALRSSLFLLLVGAFWLVLIAWAIHGRVTSEAALVEADASPWAFVAILFGVVVIQILFVGRDFRRTASSQSPLPFTRMLPTVILGIQGAGVLLLVLGQALVRLARGGHTVVLSPSQSIATEGHVNGALLWHAARTIPLVELPASL